ncbi:MAG: right-handed parallel beta-helix repeat-containing protein, partial [Candidatus Aureabacteria bacterium]|nr:right-handed parallel beta-helix repeat-containing protein [Candidatus Auribacterota bacterium]
MTRGEEPVIPPIMRTGRHVGILSLLLLSLLPPEARSDYLVTSAFDTETLTEGELRYGIDNALSPIFFSQTEFPPGSPTVITLNGALGPLRLNAGNLIIDGSANGQGPGDVVIDGNSQTVFEIADDDCSVLGLTIRNGRYGIEVDGRNATIGNQTAPNEIISNSSHGILIGSGSSTLIRGNFIGIREDGSDAGNGGDGVRAVGPGTDYNLISKNAFSGNQGLGIALINGANEGVAAPVIDEVRWLSDTEARVAGSKAAGCGLELFTADTDTAGPGEGIYYLASVPPDAGETWTIETVAGLSLGDWLTADQTTALSSTSEFSLNREFNRETPSPTPSPSATPTPPTPTPSTSPTETPTPTPSPYARPTAKLPEPIYSFDLQTDPGWSRESDWAFGAPSGRGGGGCAEPDYLCGNPDPSSGHTGNNVYGYNLDGNYPNNLPATYYLTTSPLDLSRSTGTYLQFWRWLNVETAAHDHASLQVSTDGTAWTRVWDNPAGPSAGPVDSAWTQVTFPVSAFADRESSDRFRWGMGRTDIIRTYSGWNLDDIQIWGVLDPSPSPTPSPITPTPTATPSPTP